MTRRTILKGPLHMGQDITKSEGVWRPSEVPADGDQFMYDGSDVLVGTHWGTWAPSTYETVDGRRVVSIAHQQAFGIGVGVGFKYSFKAGEAMSVLLYLDEAGIETYYEGENVMGPWFVDVRIGSGQRAECNWGSTNYPDTGTVVSLVTTSIDTTGWIAGWYRYEGMKHLDLGFSWRMYPEDSPVEWVRVQPDNFRQLVQCGGVCPQHYAINSSGGTLAVREIKWWLE